MIGVAITQRVELVPAYGERRDALDQRWTDFLDRCGLAPILVRLSAAGPAATGFWRLAFALPLLALSSRNEPGGLRGTSRFALMAGAAFALDLACWHYGIANTSVSKASVLANLTPLVVTAIAWFVFHQKPAPLFLLAVAMSVAGGAVMALSKGAGITGPNPLLGDALSAGTSIWYALYFLSMGAARRLQGTRQVMFWSSLTGLPALLLIAFVLGERLVPASPGGWAACVGLGVVHVAGQGSIEQLIGVVASRFVCWRLVLVCLLVRLGSLLHGGGGPRYRKRL